MSEYEKFPQPEELKNKDPAYTTGMNKSKRAWKLADNRLVNKNWRNKGNKLTWDEKTKLKK